MACKLGSLIGNTHTLPQPDRALVRQWLDSGLDGRGRRVSAAFMATALSREGHPVGETTCKDHKAQRCACFREE